MFGVGVLGSLVVEIGGAYRACVGLEGQLPRYYRQPAYFVCRFLLAIAGGTIASVFDAQTDLVAFYLGASAPMVIDRLTQGALPSLPHVLETGRGR